MHTFALVLLRHFPVLQIPVLQSPVIINVLRHMFMTDKETEASRHGLIYQLAKYKSRHVTPMSKLIKSHTKSRNHCPVSSLQ